MKLFEIFNLTEASITDIHEVFYDKASDVITEYFEKTEKDFKWKIKHDRKKGNIDDDTYSSEEDAILDYADKEVNGPLPQNFTWGIMNKLSDHLTKAAQNYFETNFTPQRVEYKGEEYLLKPSRISVKFLPTLDKGRGGEFAARVGTKYVGSEEVTDLFLTIYVAVTNEWPEYVMSAFVRYIATDPGFVPVDDLWKRFGPTLMHEYDHLENAFKAKRTIMSKDKARLKFLGPKRIGYHRTPEKGEEARLLYLASDHEIEAFANSIVSNIIANARRELEVYSSRTKNEYLADHIDSVLDNISRFGGWDIKVYHDIETQFKKWLETNPELKDIEKAKREIGKIKRRIATKVYKKLKDFRDRIRPPETKFSRGEV